jgi:D-lactate dehydrogenase
LQCLVSFPNVIATALQAYLTHEALRAICETTLQSVSAFENNLPLQNDVEFE